MSTGSFSVPTEVFAGVGSLSELPAVLRRHGVTRLAVVTDAALVATGLLDFVLEHIPDAAPVTILTLPPNPDVQPVEDAAEAARAAGADAVLAIGGGSALGEERRWRFG